MIGLGQLNKPHWLVAAARAKYGENIFVLGIPNDEYERFLKKINYSATRMHDPVFKGKAVVSIDCKTHINHAQPDNMESEEWYDTFEITSKKGKEDSHSKSYQLSLQKTKSTQFGGNLKLGASVPLAGFFTLGGGGPSIDPSGSVGFSRTKTKEEGEAQKETHSEKLSQEYEVVEKLRVPPQVRVSAKITTYAVTYEAVGITGVTVQAGANIHVRYRTRISQLLGGIFTQEGYLTPADIFKGENNLSVDPDGVVTFTRESKVTYLGEEVEVAKSRQELN